MTDLPEEAVEKIARIIDPWAFQPIKWAAGEERVKIERTRARADAFDKAREILAFPWLTVPEGWRPIESAPRDGTKVDLWLDSGRRIADAEWGLPEIIEDDDADEDEEGWITDYGFRTYCIGEDERVTHWLPLPAAPKPPEGAQGEDSIPTLAAHLRRIAQWDDPLGKISEAAEVLEKMGC